MLSYSEAFYQLRTELKTLYSEGEAIAISRIYLEYLTKSSNASLDRDKYLSTDQYQSYLVNKAGLLTGKPVQYVTGIQWFMNLPFKVNDSVLIPRPETEELADWIISSISDSRLTTHLRLIDIGTGSGCIPISIKNKRPQLQVVAIDISSEALELAKENAIQFNTHVNFIKLDFLDPDTWGQLGMFDIIVSNPPYIPEKDLETLDKNVKDFEPHLALFVPSNDPLLFYKNIALFAKEHLFENGSIFLEIHPLYASDIQTLFTLAGFQQIEVNKDMQGLDRMMKIRIA